MSNVYPMVSRKKRYDEASLWIARLDNNLSSEDAAELQCWMAEHPENEKLLLEMALLWDKMDSLGRLSSLFEPAPKKQILWPIIATSAFASVFVCALMLWFSVINDKSHPYPAPTEYVYQTGIGEHADVTLSDGTSLVLNTNSRMTVEYTDHHRLLTLERGEMYINVAKDKNRPLSVVAGGKVVEAVGTQFSVEINSDQNIELMVVEGKVKVGVLPRAVDPTAIEQTIKLEGRPRMMAAGETTILSDDQSDISNISVEDIEVKLSWRQGNLIFRGESLEDAVREVERYTPVEFVLLDQELKTIRVAGLFKAGDVEGLLITLRENFNIVYQYKDEKTVVLRKK